MNLEKEYKGALPVITEREQLLDMPQRKLTSQNLWNHIDSDSFCL